MTRRPPRDDLGPADDDSRTERLPSFEELQTRAPRLAIGTGPDHGSVDARRDDTGRYQRVLEQSADGVVAALHQRLDLTIRERELAHGVAELVVGQIAGALRDRPDNQRLAKLEIWAEATDAWRRKLTGEDDRNGRIGRQDLAIAELRVDVGTAAERKVEREAAATVTGVRRKLIAAVLFAAVGIGGGAWGVIQARDAAHDDAIRAESRTSGRIENLESNVRILFGFHQQPLRTSP